MSSNSFSYEHDDYWDDYIPEETWPEEEEVEYFEPYDYPEWELDSFEIEIPFASKLLNGWTIVGLVLLFIFFYAAFARQQVVTQTVNVSQEKVEVQIAGSQTAVSAPYKEYTLTQGLHGQSYGHLAIDIAAGRGEPILSPINGKVSDRYIDEYNNPTLIIENEAYIVTLLHGDYTVNSGDIIEIGDKIGSESNKGYTMDMQGNLCYGKEYCGNHTHLNIYDKRLQANVNPLDLISSSPILSH